MFINAKGIDASGQVLDLYSITINRGMRMNTWLMLVIGVVIIITVLSFCVFFCLNRRT
jgi:t-SNARE complex subunit (syntaxin)